MCVSLGGVERLPTNECVQLEAAEAETANEAQKLKQQKEEVWMQLLHVVVQNDCAFVRPVQLCLFRPANHALAVPVEHVSISILRVYAGHLQGWE